MSNEVVTPIEHNNTLPTDELKKLTEFFSLLIQIDQRIKKKGGKGNVQII
ncbi:MAG: hypothetical protein Q8P26_00590 [Candidatus Levybacteria bacterium]|nr:hypothetical protein [Candidatus Levybacteria bacterium]